MRTTLHDTVNSRFYAPLETALAAAKFSRNCPGFTDSGDAAHDEWKWGRLKQQSFSKELMHIGWKVV